MQYEQTVGDFISRPYFRLAFIAVCLILLTFVAMKEGFSLWLLSKLSLTTEHLTPTEQIAIDRFYPSPSANKAAAQRQFNAWTGVYDS